MSLKKILTEPDFALRQVKPTLLRSLNKRLSPFLPGCSFSLKHVWIMLTYRCNLSCQICGLWGKAGVWKDLPPDYLKEELKSKEITSLINDLAPYQPLVLLTGGEPLLAKNWYEVALRLKEKNLRSSISTNGTKILENKGKIMEVIDNLDVSLDGNKEIHDKIKGVPGTYELVVEGIKEIDRLKRERRQKKPHLKVSFTINDLNYFYLKEMVALLQSLNIDLDTLNFRHLEFASEKTISKHKEVFSKKFQAKTSSLDGFIFKPKIDLNNLEEQIRRIRKVRLKKIKEVIFEPDLSLPEVKDFYSNPSFVPPKFSKKCFFPWLGVSILPNGDVWLCPDYVIGNLKEERFSRLWNNEKAKALRFYLNKSGLFPACHTCASLYVY